MSVTERGSVCQELAAELLPKVSELAREMADHLYAAIPELAALDDDEVMPELVASAEANIRQVLWLFKRRAGADEVTLPPEAASFIRGNVRRGIPLPAELRGYRLGHAWLWDRWIRALQERIDDPEELIAAQDLSSALIFAYVDRVSDVLVDEYGSERERMMRGASHLRAETVRAILAGEPVDEETLHGRLGYDVRRHHVAIRVASATSEVRGLERAAREAAAAVASGRAADRAGRRRQLRRLVGRVRARGHGRGWSAMTRPRASASPSAGRDTGSRVSAARTARRSRRRASRRSRAPADSRWWATPRSSLCRCSPATCRGHASSW